MKKNPKNNQTVDKRAQDNKLSLMIWYSLLGLMFISISIIHPFEKYWEIGSNPSVIDTILAYLIVIPFAYCIPMLVLFRSGGTPVMKANIYMFFNVVPISLYWFIVETHPGFLGFKNTLYILNIFYMICLSLAFFLLSLWLRKGDMLWFFLLVPIYTIMIFITYVNGFKSDYLLDKLTAWTVFIVTTMYAILGSKK